MGMRNALWLVPCCSWTLGIKGKPSPLKLHTVEDGGTSHRERVAKLLVADADGDHKIEMPLVHTSKGEFPVEPCDSGTLQDLAVWPHLRGLPIHSAPPREISLLIGQDVPEALFPSLVYRGRRGSLMLSRPDGSTVNEPLGDMKDW